MPRSLADYLVLIPAFNAAQPDFVAAVSAALQPLASLSGFLADMPQQFDLDTAIGVQLDQVGLWIGRSRNIGTPITGVYFSWDTDGLGWEQGYWQGAFDPDEGISSLDDENFRTLLYAKAAANVWDSSPAQLNTILSTLLANEGVTATVVDNQNMTMGVTINGTLSSLVFQAILIGGYLPIKPEGVQISYLIPNAGTTTPATTADITGQGLIRAAAVAHQLASAAISGTGSLTASATGGAGTGASRTGAATLGGIGAVTGSSMLVARAGAALGGLGSVAASAIGRKMGAASIGGAGAVTASATVLSGSQQAFVVSQPDITTANNGTTVNAASTLPGAVWEAIVGNISHSTGKYYLEYHFDNVAVGNSMVGVVPTTFNASAYNNQPGGGIEVFTDSTPQSVIVTVSTAIYSYTQYVTGDVLGMAIDLGNGAVWVNLNNAGWTGTANNTDPTSGDPVANTNGIPIGLTAGTAILPVVGFNAPSQGITAHFASSSWTYAAPTGFGPV